MGLVDVAFFVTLAVVTWRAISAFKAWMTCRRLWVEASRGHARAQSVLGEIVSRLICDTRLLRHGYVAVSACRR